MEAKLKKKHKVQVQLFLSEDLVKQLEQSASDRGMTMSSLAKELMLLGMKSLEYTQDSPHEHLKGLDPSHDGRYGTG